MNAKETLLSWLESGDTARVLAGVLQVCKRHDNEELSHAASFQSGRFQDLQAQKVRGVISQTDYLLESAKIREALLLLLNRLPGDWTGEGLEQIPRTRALSKNNLRKKAWGLVAGVVVVLALVVVASEYFRSNLLKNSTDTPAQSAPADTLPATKVSTSGANSPAVNAPGGDVIINYGAPAQPAAPKPARPDSSSHQ